LVLEMCIRDRKTPREIFIIGMALFGICNEAIGEGKKIGFYDKKTGDFVKELIL
jgi:hypothetical protein